MAIIALVVMSGIVAGLTLGLMSQDATNLEILAAAGTPSQKKHAARIRPIRKNGHLLLTSLLLTNTVLNETLPILCDGLFGKGYVAVIISTALIVMFSEILPQAVCSRHGLAIGAFFAIPVRILIYFWYILAWPIAKALDALLGIHHGVMYNSAEMRELIGLHKENLQPMTIRLAQRIMDSNDETVGSCLQKKAKRPDVCLHSNMTLTKEVYQLVLAHGALPVYEKKKDKELQRDNIIGIVNTKILAQTDPDANLPLWKLSLKPIVEVPSSMPVLQLLEALHHERNSFAWVYLHHPPTLPAPSVHETKPKKQSRLRSLFEKGKSAKSKSEDDEEKQQCQGEQPISGTRDDRSAPRVMLGVLSLTEVLDHLTQRPSRPTLGQCRSGKSLTTYSDKSDDTDASTIIASSL
ncbi:hypothetical protein BCR43DRAFT_534177 [Syncephalastrum racemosum]|uniref:CNNM transmembrane domain-containing protein n=1 Tax=Syncephalastrum racemosum TaxID=13706 RepID=A0A1X2HSZ9_SYNRA|nr:hypothetical protein BCR43DRAFT_534177 [Syncephalastrum racemosum]